MSKYKLNTKKGGQSSQIPLIATIAGMSEAAFKGDGEPATSAYLNSPYGVMVDGGGNVLIADTQNHRIRRVAAGTGVITTVAGNGVAGFSGDGGAATSASLNLPSGLAMDSSGNLLILDTNNDRIRSMDARTGIITTVATNLNKPRGITVDSGGNIFVADTNNSRIVRFNAGTRNMVTVVDLNADRRKYLKNPHGVAVDRRGNVFIADTGNHRIMRWTAGSLTQVAGAHGVYPSPAGFSGDGQIAYDRMRLRGGGALHNPIGIMVDGSDNLFIADYQNHRIRRVAADTGFIDTIAGNGVESFSGDRGPGTSASLRYPTGIAMDRDGNVYIADQGNHRIRILADLSKIISGLEYLSTLGFRADSTNESVLNNVRIYKQLTGSDYVPPNYVRGSPVLPGTELSKIISDIEYLTSEGITADDNNVAMNDLLKRYKEITKFDYFLSTPVVSTEDISKTISDLEYYTSLGYTVDTKQDNFIAALARYKELTGSDYIFPEATREVSGGRRRRMKKSRKIKKSRKVKKSRRMKI